MRLRCIGIFAKEVGGGGDERLNLLGRGCEALGQRPNFAGGHGESG